MTTKINVADVAAMLERGARIAAPVIALLLTAVLLLVELAWELGHQLGTAVHRRNDELAAAWRWLLVERTAAAVVEPVEPVLPVEPVALTTAAVVEPVLHPLAVLADELMTLKATELRQVLGSRRRCSKAAMVAEVLALAY